MFKKTFCFFIILLFSGIVFMTPVCEARPPKPGHNFVWVPKHYQPDGDYIPGHWKYVGPVIVNKTWIPGHYTCNGAWIEGHWIIKPNKPYKRAVWVSGHYGPRGRWIPGHWE